MPRSIPRHSSGASPVRRTHRDHSRQPLDPCEGPSDLGPSVGSPGHSQREQAASPKCVGRPFRLKIAGIRKMRAEPDLRLPTSRLQPETPPHHLHRHGNALSIVLLRSPGGPVRHQNTRSHVADLRAGNGRHCACATEPAEPDHRVDVVATFLSCVVLGRQLLLDSSQPCLLTLIISFQISTFRRTVSWVSTAGSISLVPISPSHHLPIGSHDRHPG